MRISATGEAVSGAALGDSTSPSGDIAPAASGDVLPAACGDIFPATSGDVPSAASGDVAVASTSGECATAGLEILAVDAEEVEARRFGADAEEPPAALPVDDAPPDDPDDPDDTVASSLQARGVDGASSRWAMYGDDLGAGAFVTAPTPSPRLLRRLAM